ncbi:hypothetical protein B0H16DRAFT_1642864 [Mycena metata]|uniref:Uncharacterized protein n=1 Tax=Mycena metata TaxID=1033252 RepID=A0AAD7DUU1_9AGAR|nr:hypothetical protein B0H16DRAFT_1642864 [Mycena metata]
MSAKVQQVDCMMVDLELGVFTSNWHNLVFVIIQACVQVFFYGIYLNLFALAIYTLRRRKVEKRKILLLHMWTLTALGTTLILCFVSTGVWLSQFPQFVEQGTTMHVKQLQASFKSLQTAQHFVFVSNSLVAHCLFLYRCYVVWRSQWKVTILPGIFIVGSFVSGCLVIFPRFGTSSTNIQRIPYIMAAATNLVLVAFTAGRIWWIRRDAVHIYADDTVLNHYNTIVAMILESSALHGILTTGKAITYSSAYHYPAGISFWTIQAISVHFINIAPSLIIVRVGLGHNVQLQDTDENQTLGIDPTIKRAALSGKYSLSSGRQRSSSESCPAETSIGHIP